MSEVEDYEVPRRPKLGYSSRSYKRRVKEGFYEKYIVGKGIDIGCSDYQRAISDQVDLYNDFQTPKLKVTMCGDATYMKRVKDDTYDFVLASHILEHIKHPDRAIKNWFRILKPAGHLIICVPERDIFEFRKELPSYKNEDHKWYFKAAGCELPIFPSSVKPWRKRFEPWLFEPPVTLSLENLLKGSLPANSEIEYIKVCSENCDMTMPENPRDRERYRRSSRKKKRKRGKPPKPEYPEGECQIEAVIKKRPTERHIVK